MDSQSNAIPRHKVLCQLELDYYAFAIIGSIDLPSPHALSALTMKFEEITCPFLFILPEGKQMRFSTSFQWMAHENEPRLRCA